MVVSVPSSQTSPIQRRLCQRRFIETQKTFANTSLRLIIRPNTEYTSLTSIRSKENSTKEITRTTISTIHHVHFSCYEYKRLWEFDKLLHRELHRFRPPFNTERRLSI